jgi:hypothetical protein
MALIVELQDAVLSINIHDGESDFRRHNVIVVATAQPLQLAPLLWAYFFEAGGCLPHDTLCR